MVRPTNQGLRVCMGSAGWKVLFGCIRDSRGRNRPGRRSDPGRPGGQPGRAVRNSKAENYHIADDCIAGGAPTITPHLSPCVQHQYVNTFSTYAFALIATSASGRIGVPCHGDVPAGDRGLLGAGPCRRHLTHDPTAYTASFDQGSSYPKFS